MSPKNGLVFKKIRGGWVQPIVKNVSFFNEGFPIAYILIIDSVKVRWSNFLGEL